MRNEIRSIYIDKCFEIWTFYTLNRWNLLTSCVSVIISGDFRRFKFACPSPLFHVKRRSQGCTLRFRPLSTWRWFVPRKSFPSTFSSTIIYDLKSLHPQYQNSPRILLETSLFYLHFQVRFARTTLWTSRLDTVAKETWIWGQFSLHLWTMVETGVCSLDFVFWHE